MLLAQVLKRDSNNLDLVRLIAACLVIYGHSNAFMPAERGGGDWVAGLLKFDYSGSLAVKVFFSQWSCGHQQLAGKTKPTALHNSSCFANMACINCCTGGLCASHRTYGDDHVIA